MAREATDNFNAVYQEHQTQIQTARMIAHEAETKRVAADKRRACDTIQTEQLHSSARHQRTAAEELRNASTQAITELDPETHAQAAKRQKTDLRARADPVVTRAESRRLQAALRAKHDVAVHIGDIDATQQDHDAKEEHARREQAEQRQCSRPAAIYAKQYHGVNAKHAHTLHGRRKKNLKNWRR